jgi:uncharacterized membrane protein (UPF0127 family)
MTQQSNSTRRRFLYLTSGAAIMGSAGCIGEEEDVTEDTEEDTENTEGDTEEEEMQADDDQAEDTEEEDDWATVTISNEDGMTLAVIDAELAVTAEELRTGLSEHESLDENEGMLFIYDSEDDRTFAMPNMDFPIDIIFINSDGEITTIYEAPTEEDQTDLTEYSGRAQWVLEVRYEYSVDNGIDNGDRVEIDYHDN